MLCLSFLPSSPHPLVHWPMWQNSLMSCDLILHPIIKPVQRWMLFMYKGNNHSTPLFIPNFAMAKELWDANYALLQSGTSITTEMQKVVRFSLYSPIITHKFYFWWFSFPSSSFDSPFLFRVWVQPICPLWKSWQCSSLQKSDWGIKVLRRRFKEGSWKRWSLRVTWILQPG